MKLIILPLIASCLTAVDIPDDQKLFTELQAKAFAQERSDEGPIAITIVSDLRVNRFHPKIVATKAGNDFTFHMKKGEYMVLAFLDQGNRHYVSCDNAVVKYQIYAVIYGDKSKTVTVESKQVISPGD